jgi:hypothetical protein
VSGSSRRRADSPRRVAFAALVAAVILLPACGTAGAGLWCEGMTSEFGVRRVAALQAHVTSGGEDTVGARVRWRRHALLLSPGEWEEARTDQSGRFASREAAPGRYEVEICASDRHALHGYLEVERSADESEATLDTSRAESR